LGLAPPPRLSIDVVTCVRCGGVTRMVEAATTPDAIAKLLAKHGLGPRPPPSRATPAGQLCPGSRPRSMRSGKADVDRLLLVHVSRAIALRAGAASQRPQVEAGAVGDLGTGALQISERLARMVFLARGSPASPDTNFRV
jgi:hypothetical protein